MEKARSNKGVPSVDKISIEQFPKWGRPKWKIIKIQVETGSYGPTPAHRAEILPYADDLVIFVKSKRTGERV